MHLESFHCLLKIVYFDSKYNRRVDHLIHMLLKLSRNLVFERINKLEKGKITHRKHEILQRHKNAALKVASVCPVQTENGWRIESIAKKGKYYMVEKVSESCSREMTCPSCNICPHIYTCSCIDYCVRSTVCKHLHLIKLLMGAAMTGMTEHEVRKK